MEEWQELEPEPSDFGYRMLIVAIALYALYQYILSFPR